MCKLQINKGYLKFFKKERDQAPYQIKRTKQKTNSNNQIKENHSTIFKRRNSLQCLICDSEGSCGALSVCLCRYIALCNFEVTLNITMTVQHTLGKLAGMETAFPNVITLLFTQSSLPSHLAIYPDGHFEENLMPISSSVGITTSLFNCQEICDLCDHVSLFMLVVRKLIVQSVAHS